MKDRQEFNLELQKELDAIEQEIDEIRRNRRAAEKAARQRKLTPLRGTGPITSGPLDLAR